MSIRPVLLSGGSGTRLWPLSRESAPKQLHTLIGEQTLLQQTAQRVAGLGAPMVVCNESHRFMVAEQLRRIEQPAERIVLEPVGRNTAPAAAVAALILAEEDAGSRMLILPSDHLLRDTQAFLEAVEAADKAPGSPLVCFGVKPDHPHTGYGYIKRGAPIGESVRRVDAFVEKPDAAKASAYLDSGDYYHNTGIFLFPVARYLEELERNRPEMLECCRRAVAGSRTDLDFVRLNAEAFAEIEGESIDYAVMQAAADVVVVPVDMGWSDIGSWSALHRESDRDEAGNALVGNVEAINCGNSYFRGEKSLVVAIGLKNVAIVETGDVVLAIDLAHDQTVGQAVKLLKSKGRPEAEQTRQHWRPWGSFETINAGPRFQVKYIVVEPKQSISLQMHYHRSEHWVVVEGVAEVTRNDEILFVHENESVFIRAGTRHRLHNPGNLPLRLIEVQSGAYCGEDDIVRFEDVYGRIE